MVELPGVGAGNWTRAASALNRAISSAPGMIFFFAWRDYSKRFWIEGLKLGRELFSTFSSLFIFHNSGYKRTYTKTNKTPKSYPHSLKSKSNQHFDVFASKQSAFGAFFWQEGLITCLLFLKFLVKSYSIKVSCAIQKTLFQSNVWYSHYQPYIL